MSLFLEPLYELQNADGRSLVSGLLQRLQWLIPGSTSASNSSDAPDAVAHIIVSTSPASRLKGALGVIDVNNWKGKALNVVSLVEFGGVAATFGQLLSPKGPGCADHNTFERVANVLTSIPYVAVGIHSYRTRKTEAGKLWGASIAGVGIASGIYHGTTGRCKSFGRKLDYWTIAYSSNLLAKAAFPGVPPAVTMTGTALTPFKPFIVSFANTMAMELKFLHRSFQNPALQPAQRVHSAAALLGLGAFFLEDAMPKLPLCHAVWHCLSALGCATTNAILADAEQQYEGQQHAQHSKALADCATPLMLQA